MKVSTAKWIEGIYMEIEAEDPDISTERLLQMTADRATAEGKREFDVSLVAEALAMLQDKA